MTDLILITFTILLPITPAYILYKALPARTSVKGPFKGLNIQLSGAFGGYFLLVLTILGFISTRPQPPNPGYEVWEVKGKINWDQDGTTTDIQRIQMSLMPPNRMLKGDGTFDLQVAPKVIDMGKLRFPKLVIEHPDFQTITIDLNETKGRFGQQVQKFSVDAAAKEIILEELIGLKKKQQLPPYAPSGAPPQQAVPSNQEAIQ